MFHGMADGGATLLVSSHSLEEARHRHHLLLMRDGELLLADTPDGLRRPTGRDDLEDPLVAARGETAA
jgi:ABC-2 type transport system ATP-binding protein